MSEKVEELDRTKDRITVLEARIHELERAVTLERSRNEKILKVFSLSLSLSLLCFCPIEVLYFD